MPKKRKDEEAPPTLGPKIVPDVVRDHLRLVTDKDTEKKYLAVFIPNVEQEGKYVKFIDNLVKDGHIAAPTYIKKFKNEDRVIPTSSPLPDECEIGPTAEITPKLLVRSDVVKCCFAEASATLEAHLNEKGLLSEFNKKTIESPDMIKLSKSWMDKQARALVS